MALAQLIEVDQDKCILCHQCISVCPVKFCNDASGGAMMVNPDLCIGCGECISVCEPKARIGKDDFVLFMDALKRGEKIVAVAAPAVASNFPDEYLQLNGWLKSLGVKAVFDVSFGAELTVKTYLEHVKANKPKSVIAQPCPALVTYIQTYQPELIKYLAPADSPMMHTMKMIKEYYKEHSNHKIVVISPCFAKRREFDEVGIGDYNVVMSRISDYLKSSGIKLSSFPKVDYDNPSAERAVLFSSPGGLLRTAQREFPDIVNVARKIEGPKIIYDYFETLQKDIESGKAPLLIDCLNCDHGCNGGTGTNKDKTADQLEYYIEKRNREAQEKYNGKFVKKPSLRKIRKTVNKYWKDGLYGRKYKDLSGNLKTIKIPTQKEIDEIFLDMQKTKPEDIKNCSACGYNSCEKMAIAIYNGLNSKHNCHVYLEKIEQQFQQNLPLVHQFATGDLSVRFKEDGGNEASKFFKEFNSSLESLREMFAKIANLVNITTDLTEKITEESEVLATGAENQNNEASQIAIAVEEMSKTVVHNADYSVIAAKNAQESVSTANSGGVIVEQTIKGMKNIIDVVYSAASTISHLGSNSQQIGEIIQVIDDIADQTNLLALNAAIEAARAGEQGRGFAVVADEVRKLAERTTKATKEITNMIDKIQKDTEGAVKSIQRGSDEAEKGKELAEKSGSALNDIIHKATATVGVVNQVAASNEELSATSEQISQNIKSIHDVTLNSSNSVRKIVESTEQLQLHSRDLEKMINMFKLNSN